MKISFFKKIKEYLFVQHVTDYSFNVGKLGYCSHYKNDRINFYALRFGSWFNKWFLECIELVIWSKYDLPHITIVGLKHIFWWYLKTSKDNDEFSRKRFKITRNTNDSCG